MGKISNISANFLKKTIGVPMKHKTYNVYIVISFILNRNKSLENLLFIMSLKYHIKLKRSDQTYKF